MMPKFHIPKWSKISFVCAAGNQDFMCEKILIYLSIEINLVLGISLKKNRHRFNDKPLTIKFLGLKNKF